MAEFPAMHQYSLHLLQDSLPLLENQTMPMFKSTYPAIGNTKTICVQLGGYNFRFFP
jgi:hypothetical protein